MIILNPTKLAIKITCYRALPCFPSTLTPSVPQPHKRFREITQQPLNVFPTKNSDRYMTINLPAKLPQHTIGDGQS